MTKQKTLRRVSIIVVAILLITMSLLCVTLAKYQTSIDGSLTGEARTWVVKASVGSDSTPTEVTTLTLANDLDAYPGMTNAEYVIKLENGGEVGAAYKIETGSDASMPKNMKVAYSSESGTIDAKGTVSITVTVSWEFGDDSSVSDDTKDAGTPISIPVVITVTQNNG